MARVASSGIMWAARSGRSSARGGRRLRSRNCLRLVVPILEFRSCRCRLVGGCGFGRHRSKGSLRRGAAFRERERMRRGRVGVAVKLNSAAEGVEVSDETLFSSGHPIFTTAFRIEKQGRTDGDEGRPVTNFSVPGQTPRANPTHYPLGILGSRVKLASRAYL